MDQKRTIAVVDDDPRVLESLENLLESAGYIVQSYSSGEGFLVRGLSEVDCLVTDIGMPGMDGLELLDITKRMQPDIPVFLLTGRHEFGDQCRTTATDIEGLFKKPFDGQELLSAIAKRLSDINTEGDNDQ